MNHTLRQTTCPRVAGQRQMDSMILVYMLFVCLGTLYYGFDFVVWFYFLVFPPLGGEKREKVWEIKEACS